MALIKCPECTNPVSSLAPMCPACGYPVAAQTGAGTSKAAAGHELLAQAQPSWWRFFWHLFFFWLIVPPLVAWARRASVVLRIYPGRVTVERGLITKCYREFLVRDIRAIDIDQGFLARLVGMGDLTISTSATVDAAERIEGVPNPHALRELILAQRGHQ
ncbi:MAG TPA: PH domain-containing protein [Verrucomicrobiae bacterium]|nr:PH domain-containing protein [Verrucomicrobiae bacterium]